MDSSIVNGIDHREHRIFVGFSERVDRNYRALIKRSTSPSGGTWLHLIREDAETSLCGIPRAQLSSAGGFDELLCPECIEWLPKRERFSDEHPKVRRT